MDTDTLPTLPPETPGSTLPPSNETTGNPFAETLASRDVQAQNPPSTTFNLGGESASTGGKSTAEQREKWKNKARLRRLSLKQAGQSLPPPLPAENPTIASETKTPVDSVGGLPSVEDIALVDWTDEDIKEITDELVEWLAQLDKDSARKAAELAKLGDRLIQQIEQDAEMPSIVKKIFKKTLPRYLAKLLNKTGLSAEHKELAEIIVGVLFYAYHRSSLTSRIKKMTKEAALAQRLDK